MAESIKPKLPPGALETQCLGDQLKRRAEGRDPLPPVEKVVDELLSERERVGDLCVDLAMICEALDIPFEKSSEIVQEIKKIKLAHEEDLGTLRNFLREYCGKGADNSWIKNPIGAMIVAYKFLKNDMDALKAGGDKAIAERVLREDAEMSAKRAEAAEVEVARLQRHVADLQSGMFINCVYCGHRYGPSEGTPAIMADVLKQHIAGCPKHPLFVVSNALRELVETKDMVDKYGKTPEYEKRRELAWSGARDALKGLPKPEQT